MLKKTILIITCLVVTISLFSFTMMKKPAQQQVKTIVIDAGHGIMSNGGYNGAKGAYSYEDEICYAISKKTIALIAKEFPEIRIVETRPTRKIVDLRERADIANANKGDLFISIHVNAAPPIQKREFTGYKTQTYYTGKGKKRKKQTRKVAQYRHYTIPNPSKGTETYIWGAHKNEDKELAIRENAPMFAEDNYQEKYGAIDPNSPEFIALSLVKTKQFFKRSSNLANFVENEFVRVGRASRGSYQREKGIWVLQATAMPSILVETGFITNRTEEDYLNSEEGQNEISECIVRALRNYISWLEKNGTINTQTQNQQKPSSGEVYSFLQAMEESERHAHAE